MLKIIHQKKLLLLFGCIYMENSTIRYKTYHSYSFHVILLIIRQLLFLLVLRFIIL